MLYCNYVYYIKQHLCNSRHSFIVAAILYSDYLDLVNHNILVMTLKYVIVFC